MPVMTLMSPLTISLISPFQFFLYGVALAGGLAAVGAVALVLALLFFAAVAPPAAAAAAAAEVNDGESKP